MLSEDSYKKGEGEDPGMTFGEKLFSAHGSVQGNSRKDSKDSKQSQLNATQ